MPTKTGTRGDPPRAEKVSMNEVARRASEMIQREGPALRVERHWGHEWYVGTDMVFAVGAFAQHASVEFWRGSTVPDPDHLLEGTGKNLRHVKLRTVQEASSPRLVRLLRAAVAMDRMEPKRAR